jgi:hypothetical protein
MTTATPLGGTARQEHVPSQKFDCPTHGEVEGRVHKIGFDRHGNQRTRTRCPICHTIRNGGSGLGLALTQ